MLPDGYDLVIYGPIAPRSMKHWALTSVIISRAGSVALFDTMSGIIVIDPLANRPEWRKAVLSAITLASICTLGTMQAWDVKGFIALRFVTGAELGGATPNIVVLMNNLVLKTRHNRMTTTTLSFHSIGAIFSVLVAMSTTPHFGQEAASPADGISLLFLPWMYRQLPEPLSFLLKRDRAAASTLLKRIDPAVNVDRVRFDISVRTSSEAPLSRLFIEGCDVGMVFLWPGFGIYMLMAYGFNTWLPKTIVIGGSLLGPSP